MNLLRHHIFYICQGFFKYNRGFTYIKNRYFYAKRILNKGKITPSGKFNSNLSIHMLVCRFDYLGGLWALASFLTESKIWGNIFIHNDGSLTVKEENYFSNLFPNVNIIRANEFVDRHQDRLKSYPTIFSYRKVADNFQAKKLVDTIFASKAEMMLIIDPDLIWFKAPQEIEKAIEQGPTDFSLMMSNGADWPCFVTYRDGTKLDISKAYFNSGIVLCSRSTNILKLLEEYLGKFDFNDVKVRSQHFFEQAGFASILPNIQLLPEQTYIIKGQPYDKIVVRHYTGPSRAKFYLDGILRIKYRV